MNFTSTHIDANTMKHHFENNGEKLSNANWIEAMLNSDEAVKKFNQLLKDSSFSAYFWEVKPVNKSKLEAPFEFVLVNSVPLKTISADDSSFDKYFDEHSSAVNFPNLRGDAELVVPSPISKTTEYAHLAQFVRTADEQEIIEFWRKVAATFKMKVGDELKWLSTSGLGVYWLHVRIDSQPKYYQHSAYKQG